MSEIDVQSRGNLVVELGGLIASNILLEIIWGALSVRWTALLHVPGSIVRSRISLKHQLEAFGFVDVSLLPYNQEVLAYISRWRSEGGRTVLVSAIDHALAEKIARYLGLFDEVYGSDSPIELKGGRKAAALIERFGREGFAYLGTNKSDLPVWEKASKAIIVAPNQKLRDQIKALGREIEYLAQPKSRAKEYLKALRPHQWLKNILVFVPMLAAHQFTPETFRHSVLSFIAFCLVASSAYLLNDLLDLASDRAHSRKRDRPLASGAIPIAHGTWLAPLFFLIGIGFAVPLGVNFLLVILGYYAGTASYSLFFKRRLVIDICILAGLYTMRVLAGGVATAIPLSVWLLAFSIFFFFSLAAVKRQAELVDGIANSQVRAHGRGYQIDDLPLVATMATAAGYVSVLVMALYLNSPAVLELYQRPYALWGICLVLIYWISRIVMTTHRGRMHDDPIVYAVKDRVSQVCFLLALLFAAAGALP